MKKLLVVLLTLLSFGGIAQTGQYTLILESGYCQNGAVWAYNPNPRIVTIDPSGTITSVSLPAVNSHADILQHVAQFNAAVSNILDLGYTYSPIGADFAYNYTTIPTNTTWADTPCGTTNAFGGYRAVTLIPCCSAP